MHFYYSIQPILTVLCSWRYKVRHGSKAVSPTKTVMFFVKAFVFNELAVSGGLEDEGYLDICQSHGEPERDKLQLSFLF